MEGERAIAVPAPPALDWYEWEEDGDYITLFFYPTPFIASPDDIHINFAAPTLTIHYQTRETHIIPLLHPILADSIEIRLWKPTSWQLRVKKCEQKSWNQLILGEGWERVDGCSYYHLSAYYEACQLYEQSYSALLAGSKIHDHVILLRKLAKVEMGILYRGMILPYHMNTLLILVSRLDAPMILYYIECYQYGYPLLGIKKDKNKALEISTLYKDLSIECFIKYISCCVDCGQIDEPLYGTVMESLTVAPLTRLQRVIMERLKREVLLVLDPVDMTSKKPRDAYFSDKRKGISKRKQRSEISIIPLCIALGVVAIGGYLYQQHRLRSHS